MIRSSPDTMWAGLKAGLQRVWGPGRERRLRLCETVPLGERRFVALIECDGQSFLVGGGRETVSLLARLSETEEGTACR